MLLLMSDMVLGGFLRNDRCIVEGLILVSLDKHFANVLRFPPEPTAGIVELRGPNDLFSTTGREW